MQMEQLNTTLPEDLDDILRRVETSFNIRFEPIDLEHVTTFGGLCDIIISKIRLTAASNCTSQQAFYKLRRALASVTPEATIAPDSQLALLLPQPARRKLWREVESQLGFKLDILGASPAVFRLIFLAFPVSLLLFFFSPTVACLGLVLATLAAVVAGETGTTLQVLTVRECVEKMAREHYLHSRSSPATFNPLEVTRYVQELFRHGLYLPLSALGREAAFV